MTDTYLQIAIDKMCSIRHYGYMKTAAEIKKAIKVAGIEGELTGRGREWEVKVSDKVTAIRFCDEIVNVRGYMNEYGEWTLRPGHNYGDACVQVAA